MALVWRLGSQILSIRCAASCILRQLLGYKQGFVDDAAGCGHHRQGLPPRMPETFERFSLQAPDRLQELGHARLVLVAP